MKLQGRSIIVTGASVGLGRMVAAACLAEGASVVICGRNEVALREAELFLASDRVVAVQADVSNPSHVHHLFEVADRAGELCGLVNNAGIYGPKGLSEDVSWADWLETINVNLGGTVLACREAAKRFRLHGHGGKIVNLSGGGATSPQPRFSAYAASKAAVVRFTETLAEELRDAHVDVNAVAPGALNTRLLDELLAAGPTLVGQATYERALKQQKDGGAPPERAVALCVFLLSSESDGITGRLISSIWDPWETFAERRAEIAASDVYTLRRIVPKDRGLGWE